MKILRKCPACRAENYYPAWFEVRQPSFFAMVSTAATTISEAGQWLMRCTNCLHVWPCRPRLDEREGGQHFHP